MSDSLIRAQIVTILTNVAGVTNVYDRIKLTHLDAEFKTLFTANSFVNFWTVTRVNSKEKKVALGNGASGSTQVNHTYQIEGFYGWQDSTNSEAALHSLIDLISAAFRSHMTLNGTVQYHTYIHSTIAPSIRSMNAQKASAQMVQGRLCNKCILTLDVFELI